MLGKITYNRALEMMREQNSLMVTMNKQEHLALHPKYMGNLKQGVTTMLDSLMSLYQTRFEGVPMAFNNIQMVQKQAANISYQPFLHFDIKADFIVFKPELGSLLKGVIQKVEKDHISCLVHGVFNAWFPKEALLSVVKETDLLSLLGSEVEFKVTKFSSNNGVLSLRGDFKRILKRKSQYFISSTPAINNRTLFGDEDDVMNQYGSPGLDQSFNPPLSSTQVETPLAVNEKQKKRKLSEVLEDETVRDNLSLQESGIGNMYSSKGSKKKKKKKKHELVGDLNSSINSEVNSSLASEMSAEFSSESKKKKAKHNVDTNFTEKSESSFSLNMHGNMVENSSTKKKKKKKKKHTDEVVMNFAENSDINSSLVSDKPFDMACDNSKMNKKNKHKHTEYRMNHIVSNELSPSLFSDSQDSQNHRDGMKANKKRKSEKTLVRQFYSKMSPSPEKDAVETNMYENCGKSRVLFQDRNPKRDNSVPSVNDFFKGFFDSMIAAKNSDNKSDYKVNDNNKKPSIENQRFVANGDDFTGITGTKKSKKKLIEKAAFNETQLSASLEDFVIEKIQGQKKKKKKKRKVANSD